MRWPRVLIVWFLLMGAEVIHGILRTLWLVPIVGDFKARQIGVFTGSLIIFAIVFISFRWIGANRNCFLIAIGFTWFFLTLIFEISLGHFIFGYSFERIAEDYNVLQGGILPFGLLFLFLSPIIVKRLRGTK